MLSLFRRRKGRHQLGAAVTSIPSVQSSVARAVPAQAQARTPGPAPAGMASSLPAPSPPPSPPPVVAPVPAPVAVPTPAGPRVELGFRDGSRASLDPSSEQARALEDIAAVLTRKD